VKPFRERNPVTVGAVGIIVLLLMFYAAFNAAKLPIIGGGTSYAADFSDLSGLNKGDDVRVAGVKVGHVTGYSLEGGNYVRVTFDISSDIDLGDATRAAIKIKTLLGQKYLALDPQGLGELDGDIPLERTTAPFDVPAAFQGLASTVGDIDTKLLAKSFDTISTTFDNSPKSVKAALSGLSRLSHTVSSRDAQLQSLLRHADGVTNVLDQRRGEVQSLIDDGDLLLQMVERRRAAIHELLVNTSALANQLTGLVRDNQAQLHPTLTHLSQVVHILKKNQTNIDKGIQVLAPFVRDFANTLGNGRWFDTIIFNLPPQNPQFCTPPKSGCFIEPKDTH
jgi:phospholipid/cholesterol/gamma-HCH transport system substrate-binding protein